MLINRRQFLKTLVVSASGVAGLHLSGCDDEEDLLLTDAAYFPQSVASGDPKPSSVVLWTRVVDVDKVGNISLELQVSEEETFNTLVISQKDLMAEVAHDHCLKVKVVDLKPNKTYYYRFIYKKINSHFVSPTGRTRTAPQPETEADVQFALLNCQDYVGRYYHTLRHLSQQQPDLNFILHVGDYIYETTGDPSFQTSNPQRTIQFSDQENALMLGEGETAFYAAKTLSNYRDLYKTYRSDPYLQKIHERYPFIVVWDDHEYSDDCYGATATYFNGLTSELDQTRRVHAEQAFFEFLPIDTSEQTITDSFTTTTDQLYPNTQLYRDFQFGRNLHLLVTDYRSFRPDHLLPEDGFPGKVLLDKETLINIFDSQQPGSGEIAYETQKLLFGPYVDMRTAPWQSYAPALVGFLTQAYQQEGLSEADAQNKAQSDLSGQVSAFIFNQLVEQFNNAVASGNVPGGQSLPLIDQQTYDTQLDRGLALLHLGKQRFFSEFGSRYGVVKPFFDLYSDYLYQTGQANENVFGDTQEQWLKERLQTSPATFIALASSVSTTSLIADLSAESTLPEQIRAAFYLNVDHWDGFPHKKQELLELLGNRGNSFFVCGDIHASFVNDYGNVVDFTAPAVSSGTFNSFMDTAVLVFGETLTESQTDLAKTILQENLDETLQKTSSALKFADTTQNGYVIVHVGTEAVEATYHLLPANQVTDLSYQQASDLQLTSKVFTWQDNQLVEKVEEI